MARPAEEKGAAVCSSTDEACQLCPDERQHQWYPIQALLRGLQSQMSRVLQDFELSATGSDHSLKERDGKFPSRVGYDSTVRVEEPILQQG
jgi:hypothetical protein